MTITILCAGALARPRAAAQHSEPAVGVPLPRVLSDGALARAMRRARVVAHRRQTALVPDELPDEAWLRERFGVDGSVAACALPQFGPAGSQLLVRPVHLHLAMDHLVLAQPDRLELGRDQADALAEHANAVLADEGLRLHVATADTWCLDALDAHNGPADVAALAALLARSARMAAGRSIDAYQPSGAAARRWRQLSTLMQMTWFEHPVNVAREAAGHLPINALWLEGRAGNPTRRPFARVAAADAWVTGLARRAGIDTCPIDAHRAGADEARGWAAAQQALDASGDLLLAPDFWQQPVSDGDRPAWEQAWLSFERWFAALANASPRLSGDELRLVLTGERSTIELQRSPADRWKAWRRLRLAALVREAT